MSIQNLQNNRVKINPLNLKVDPTTVIEADAIANGQLSWQFVKKGFLSVPDENYYTNNQSGY